MHIDYRQIGRYIKRARKMRSMTQEQLAEHLDVSIGYVSQVERGITKISLDLLAAIATVLDCEISFFIDGVTMAQKNYLTDALLEQISTLSAEKKQFLLKLIPMLNEF